MKKTENNNFETIIKLAADTDALPADFTQSVMQIVEADAAQELALKKVLQRHPAEGPAMDFTANIMAQINAKPAAKVYGPIIARKVWYGIAAMVAVFIALLQFTDPAAETVAEAGRLTAAMEYISVIPAVYVLALVVIGGLLLIDYLISFYSKSTELKDV